METQETVKSTTVVEKTREKKELSRFVRVFFGRKAVLCSTIVIGVMVFCAVFADVVAPYDPYEQNLANALASPSLAHPLGTDGMGRDTLSRVIFGARISLMVGCVSVFLAAFLGSVFGLISGYFGGWLDAVVGRTMDALLALPPIMLALAIGAALGSGPVTVIVALTLGLIPTFVRVMRGQVLSVRELDYVKASEVIGANTFRIIVKHVFPNCVSPIIILITLNLGVAILAESALSYLGVGIAAPEAAWGAMIGDGQRYLSSHPILSFAPGFLIVLTVLSFNMMGDGLRDALDPRMKGSM